MTFELVTEHEIPESFYVDPDYYPKRTRALETALRLVMACSEEMECATDAELEAALECGDPVKEQQANAWMVARLALSSNMY